MAIKTIEQVRTFMTTFGQEVKTRPQLPDTKTRALRVSLLAEEVKELEEAFADNNLVAVLDALTDIRYVLEGAYLACGLQDVAEAAFDEVQRSNMSKLDKNGNVVRREDGKVLKSELYFPPNLAKVLENYLQVSKSQG